MIITIKHDGKVYQRVLFKKQGFYVIESKGVEYWFGHDVLMHPKTMGWHIVNGKTLPDFMLDLISRELVRVSKEEDAKK